MPHARDLSGNWRPKSSEKHFNTCVVAWKRQNYPNKEMDFIRWVMFDQQTKIHQNIPPNMTLEPMIE